MPLFAPAVLGQGKPKLVVIGGGPGGGTVARYVNKDHKGAIDVTLIEPQKKFTTCFFSNIYVGGYRSFKSITHSYDKVRKEGVKIVHEAAASIDRDKREVVLAGGKRIPYDRLVVAPGIDIKFDSVPGYSEAAAQVMPHAWKPGPQTELLVRKLNALKDGDTIVMIAPPNPYRCPPGPVRAGLDVRACAEEEGAQEVEDHRARSEAELLQAGAVPRRLGEALSGHDRMAGPEDAWRHQGRRSEDRRDQDRSCRTTRRRSPTSFRRRWRARSRATPASRTSPASARSIRRT